MSDGPSIFLSYTRADVDLASSFVDVLRAQGLNVWWGQGLEGGDAFRESTEAALAAASAVIVLWTPASIASPWVISEAMQARDSGRFISVASGCVPPIGFRQFQFINAMCEEGRIEPGFGARLGDIVRRTFIDAKPRFANRRGFVVVDFTHAYRLRAWKAAILSFLIQLLFYLPVMGIDWIKAGAIEAPSKLPAFFLLSSVSLWIGRLIIPDAQGIRRSSRERFLERRPVIVWLSCLGATWLLMLAFIAYKWQGSGLDVASLISVVLGTPLVASAMFIVPAMVLWLLNTMGVIDRNETMLKLR